MFQRLLGRDRRANRAISDSVYATIVAAARRPEFYSAWEIPDTPLGRFEMIALHMFLFQHRLLGETGATRELAQAVIDEFFSDVDHSLRELGVGDMGVPKRMKKLARMFYGRAAAYAAALAKDDRELLAAALARNICPETPDWRYGKALADYVVTANEGLAGQSSDTMCSGRLFFPNPTGA